MGLFKKKIQVKKDQVWKRNNDNPFIKEKYCKILDVKDGYVLYEENAYKKDKSLGADYEHWFRERWTFHCTYEEIEER